ncbi:MAG: lamin tail domain-containing protein [Planctomycetota bacterium]|nr:lamin tail domain-containing protein [Planctomycetota bacterium]
MRMQLRLAATILSFIATVPCFGGLVITEVASTSGAPAGGSLESRDWWELTNTGPAAVLLNGYSWEDRPASGDRAIFPNGITIATGESIIIHKIFENTPVSADFRSTWGLPNTVQILEESQFTGANPFSGLGTCGDDLRLFNPGGVEVASVVFGSSTSGVTFEWDQNGTSLGLSVAGENGATTSSYGGVGSPGRSVPEPSTATLGIVALCLATRIVQRKS